MAENVGNDLSSSEASAAEIISKMSEYQFIAVVQDGNSCEPMEQVVNEKGEVVAINTDEYYETLGQTGSPVPAVELNFNADQINDLKNSNINESDTNRISDMVVSEIRGNSDEILSDISQTHSTTSGIIDDDIISQQIQHQHQQGGQSATNCTSLKDILLPLGIKIQGDHKIEIGSKRKRPKSSLFIGCSMEASQVIYEFEQLKERLQIPSNLEMLKHMIKTENKYLNSTVVTTECMVDDGNKNTKAILELLSSSTGINNKNSPSTSTENSLENENSSNLNLETRSEEVTINILK